MLIRVHGWSIRLDMLASSSLRFRAQEGWAVNLRIR